MQDGMMEYKAEGSKFLVELKNDQGDYEFLGVLSFPEATRLQFTAHRAVRMQRVCDLDNGDKAIDPTDAIVGCQDLTWGDAHKAVMKLIAKLKADMGPDENVDMYDLRNGYSTSGTRDLSENQWPLGIVSIDTKSVVAALSQIEKPITEGCLEVYFNDYANNEAVSQNHGIWIKDGRIYKVY